MTALNVLVLFPPWTSVSKGVNILMDNEVFQHRHLAM